MPATPTVQAEQVFTSPAGNDIVHFRNTPGQVVSWIDTNGFGQGNLASMLPIGTVATVTSPAQSGSISTTTLYPVPSNGAGLYVVYLDLIVTTVGTGGTVTANISWNNGTTMAGLNTNPLDLTIQSEQPAESGNFYSAASQNITYSTTVSGATGSPQYALRIRLQYLG